MDFEPIIIAEAHRHNIYGMTWEDIAQEIRMRLWVKEKLWDATKSSYRTWANKVMRNCIIDLLRTANYKKAQYLNRAVSIDKLKEKGFDISNKGEIYKPED